MGEWYDKHTWSAGEFIKPGYMNHIEENIQTLHSELTSISDLSGVVSNETIGMRSDYEVYRQGRPKSNGSSNDYSNMPNETTKSVTTEVFSKEEVDMTQVYLKPTDEPYKITVNCYSELGLTPFDYFSSSTNWLTLNDQENWPVNLTTLLSSSQLAKTYFSITFVNQTSGAAIDPSKCLAYVKRIDNENVPVIVSTIQIIENNIKTLSSLIPEEITSASQLDNYPHYIGSLAYTASNRNHIANVAASNEGKQQYVVIPVQGGQRLTITGNNDYDGMRESGKESRPTRIALVRSYDIGQPTGNTTLDLSRAPDWTEIKELDAPNLVESTIVCSTFDGIIPNDAKYLLVSTLFTAGGITYNVTPSQFNLGPHIINHLCMGDSITEGYYSVPDDAPNTENHHDSSKTYTSWMAARTGFNITNKGVGGAGWVMRGAGKSNPKLNVCGQIMEHNFPYTADNFTIDFTKYDILTIMIGINDWKGSKDFGPDSSDAGRWAPITPEFVPVDNSSVVEVDNTCPLNAGYYQKYTIDNTTYYTPSTDLTIYGPYYKISAQEIATPFGSPAEQGWFEVTTENNDMIYFRTTDTTVNSEKTYYNLAILPRSYNNIFTNDVPVGYYSPSEQSWFKRIEYNNVEAYQITTETKPRINSELGNLEPYYYILKYRNANDTIYEQSVFMNMRYFIETVLTRNPKLKLILISPLNSSINSETDNSESNDWGAGYAFNNKTLNDLCSLMSSVAEHYNIQFIDMLHNSPINRVNIQSMLHDGVHPSLEAHRLIGIQLASYL